MLCINIFYLYLNQQTKQLDMNKQIINVENWDEGIKEVKRLQNLGYVARVLNSSKEVEYYMTDITEEVINQAPDKVFENRIESFPVKYGINNLFVHITYSDNGEIVGMGLYKEFGGAFFANVNLNVLNNQ